MPELPEVETVVQLLNTLVVGKTVKNVEVYWDNIIAHPDVETFSEQVVNQTFKSVDRRGKYIIFNLSDGSMVSHLRMEGKYYVYDEPVKKDKHTHVIFNFTDNSQLHYHDTRKFGKMYLYGINEELKAIEKIGLEPWDENLDSNYLLEKAKNRKISIKAFLLDQNIIAGIGNIYVNEICFVAKVHPATAASKITKTEFDTIIEATKDILERAILAGGTTIKSYTSSLGVTGLFQQSLLVHNKTGEPCTICSTLIKKITVSQRGTYLCPTCQTIK